MAIHSLSLPKNVNYKRVDTSGSTTTFNKKKCRKINICFILIFMAILKFTAKIKKITYNTSHTKTTPKKNVIQWLFKHIKSASLWLSSNFVSLT